MVDASRVVGRSWVHVIEQDTPDGLVFRPAESDIPLSRRPRAAFELRTDGSALLTAGGPADGPRTRPGSWTHAAGTVLVHEDDGRVRWRIVEATADQLVVLPG